MPISEQIVVTPETIATKNFTISAVTRTSTTATYTANGHTFSAGDIVLVTGIAPDGYNGTFTISSIATNTFTVANTTNLAITDANGDAFSADSAEYEYEGYSANFLTDNDDVTELINTNAQVSAAFAAGQQAQADAAVALSNANTALNNASIAYSTAINSLQPSAFAIQNPSTKQLTAIDATGLTVYSGASATSGARVVMNSAGIAGFNASNQATFSVTASTGAAVFKGDISASTITGSNLNIGGKFVVDGTTGLLSTTDATFLGTITSNNATITGLLTINNAVITGKAFITSGYIGSEASGWNFRAAGTIANNDNSTILYPTGAANAFAMITNRPIASKGIQCDGNIETTGNFVVSSNGTNFNRNQFSYYNTISSQSISGGYGIDSNWSPNSDNTYSLGLSGSFRWSRVFANNTTISTSDMREKTNIVDSPLGLEFIEALRPVSFKWIQGSQEVIVDENGAGIVIGQTPENKPIYKMKQISGKRSHYGFIAQEVKQVLDEANVGDFAGWVIDNVDDPDSRQSLSYEQFISPLVKAVQELSARVKQLEGA